VLHRWHVALGVGALLLAGALFVPSSGEAPGIVLALSGMLVAGYGAISGARRGSRRALALGLALAVACGAVAAVLLAGAQLGALGGLARDFPSP
jgi:hypothetical protein